MPYVCELLLDWSCVMARSCHRPSLLLWAHEPAPLGQSVTPCFQLVDQLSDVHTFYKTLYNVLHPGQHYANRWRRRQGSVVSPITHSCFIAGINRDQWRYGDCFARFLLLVMQGQCLYMWHNVGVRCYLPPLCLGERPTA